MFRKQVINMMTEKRIQVAVVVIHYKDKYLLGFRHANQHQGNRYEFIGGKIEATETPKNALLREVFEEIGCNIEQNLIIKMGIIQHDYEDKKVVLHIFKIKFNSHQYQMLQQSTGKEGQAICWVNYTDLLANKYSLPDANAQILSWLRLSEIIFISRSLDNFKDEKNSIQAWLTYYQNKLPQSAILYIRPQCENLLNYELNKELVLLRPDITVITQLQAQQKNDLIHHQLAIHLNHQQLLTVDSKQLSKNQHYFISCHDEYSLTKLNQLNQTHSIIGCFLSPVFSTPTHRHQQGMGWQKFFNLANKSHVPVFALGGIWQKDKIKAQKNQAFGIAGIRLLEEF